MQKRTPHPVEQVEAIMRKIEASPVLTEIEKEILFAHIQDGSQYAAPLPISIAKDDDGHFCIAIDGRKWKIMRHGIIGNGAADREDFHQAASELVDNALPFSDAGLERVVLSSDLLSLADDARAYRSAMNYRASVWKSLGEVMYDAYCQSLPCARRLMASHYPGCCRAAALRTGQPDLDLRASIARRQTCHRLVDASMLFHRKCNAW